MAAYHQMGHDSKNLLGTVSKFSGAIVSPVNEVESDIALAVTTHASDSFEFIFDPQLYFPRRADRGQLSTWSYFPKDFETADMSSDGWWTGIIDELAATAARVGCKAVCSPAIISGAFSNDYYETMRAYADRLVAASAQKNLRVLETVLVKLDEVATANRAFEIASVVSNTKAAGIYLVLISDVKPRDELREVEQLKGAMKLIHLLESAGLPVLVGCSSSDLLLWKAAGATSCATGKFANLRRFAVGRFNEEEGGGRQVAYWFEEALMAFLRSSDLARVQPHGIATATTANSFGQQILEQLATDPAKAWIALGWRQYMQSFADLEQRLSAGTASSRELIRTAESNWKMLEERDVFMEERNNDGAWLRPWLRAVVEFNK